MNKKTLKTKGRVVWFNSQKGFGFAVPDITTVDVLIENKTVIYPNSSDIKQLSIGQRIYMEIVPQPSKGFIAVKVIPIEIMT